MPFLPKWVKVRSDLSPSGDGYVMLDKTNLQTATSIGDTSWSYPTLASGLASDSDNPVRYRKDGVGVIHLQGGFSKTTSGGFSGTAFTLPTGYRPSGLGIGAGTAVKHSQFWVYMSSSGFNLCRVSVGQDGAVYVNDAMFNGDFLEFGHISFYADN